MRPLFALSGLLAVGLACTGVIPPPGAEGHEASADGDLASDDASPRGTRAACTPGVAPLRRLTRFEYDNALRDLLGDDLRPAEVAFPAEVGGNGFGNDAHTQDSSQLLVGQYFEVARAAARRATADAARVLKLTGCAPGAAEADCARGFIARFGLRAYRRPLEVAETERLLALWMAERQDGDAASATAAVLATMLQAPPFLYRLEAARPGDRLSPYEMATRLSFLLWGSVPDEDLLRSAGEGHLSEPADVEAQARRMLEGDGAWRARVVTDHFHRMRWKLAGLEAASRDPKLQPGWRPGLGPRLAEEARRFAEHVVWDGEGDLQALLVAPYTFVDAELAAFYGVTPPSPGVTWNKIDLDPARRAGFATQAGVLTLLTPGAHTNPIKRGMFVREQVLCGAPPPPPASLMIELPEPDPALSTRDSFAQHSSDPACSACHVLIDPIGFAFETYDGVGLWRDTEHDKPIVTRGKLEGTDVDGEFESATDLMRRLAGSGDARECYLRSWFQFGFGRGETSADACTIESLGNRFAESNGNVRELLIALTQTTTFLTKGSAP
jgi:hypothetical protein